MDALERRSEFETGDMDCNSEIQKKEKENLILQDFLELAKRKLKENKAKIFLKRLVSYEKNPTLYQSDEEFLKEISTI